MRLILTSLLLTIILPQMSIGDEPGKKTPLSFNQDIRPILSGSCFQCHGPDKQQRKADLRLDIREAAIKSAIVPGNADKSELLARVLESDPDLRMPPEGSHKKALTSQQVTLLRDWINEGAKYEKHWSYLPPRKSDLPPVKNRDWIRNPIDQYVLAKLEEQKLAPAAQADRRTLLRRVTLDLTGLPPTPEEIRAFVADNDENAYEKVVDRLLKSPHYGEHLARYWLDAARYADTNGYQYDLEREQWVWRDWVINAFNTNQPFDQFTIEQIAGDLLPNATPQQTLATGFHRNHPITIEGGVIDEEYRTEYVVDRVVTTSTVWMGMTFLCSRCHDHKYDLIEQKEFYQFFAFFNQVPERGNNGFNPKLQVASPLASSRLKELEAEITKAEKEYQTLLGASKDPTAEWETKLSQQLKTQWQVIVPEKMVSQGGATLKVLDDQSILSTGKNPPNETYEFTIKLNQPVSGIRLEALKDDSHVHKSTGKAFNGNFVLSEFQAEIGQSDAEKFTPVKIASASADYNQTNYNITAAIDGKIDRTGWAVDGNTNFKNKQAMFQFAQPTGKTGDLLRVRLIHKFGSSHQIGRVRLSLSNGELSPIPFEIAAILQTPATKRTTQEQTTLKNYLLETYGPPELREIAKQLAELRQRRATLTAATPATMVMQEMPTPRATHVLHRGEYDKPREKISAGVPAVLPPLPEGVPANRLGLAKWLVAPNHPLTARVTVNRFWQRFFGTGIVKTVEDFGSQGEWPSHPDLLDWLAVTFIESGWDVKALHKQIVMSATYRQSSKLTKNLLQIDPENRFLTRGPRLRFDAEMIRDSALAVSGLLVKEIGGPSVLPYHPAGLWQEINNRPGYSRTYKQQHGANLYRRSMYTFWKRTVPPPSMATFDAPEREYCVVQRSRTNTPLQAFVLLHDPQFVEAARLLGQRMMNEGGTSIADRLAYGFELCTARRPGIEETKILQTEFDAALTKFSADPAAKGKLLSIGEAPQDPQLDPTELAAYTTIARMLLNLSEFITKP